MSVWLSHQHENLSEDRKGALQYLTCRICRTVSVLGYMFEVTCASSSEKSNLLRVYFLIIPPCYSLICALVSGSPAAPVISARLSWRPWMWVCGGPSSNRPPLGVWFGERRTLRAKKGSRNAYKYELLWHTEDAPAPPRPEKLVIF